MAILVYPTTLIRTDMSSHGLPERKLTEFIQEIEEAQSLERFDKHYPHPCLVKSKWYDYNNRLIATRRPIGGHQVVVLLRMLIRSSAEYRNDFWGDPTSYIQRQLSSVNADTLASWVEERTRVSPPPTPPALSDSEQTFLWSPAYPELHDDMIICATHEWVSDSKDTRVKPHCIRVPAMIEEGLSAADDQITTIRSGEGQKLALQVLNSRATGQCVLLSLTHGATDEALAERADKWAGLLKGADAEQILRYCRVAYPSLMLCDEDKWMAMHSPEAEGENIANLSLSPEECTILRSCDQHKGQRTGFPLFINGRAGSGKSTLLQYLFAFTFRRWWDKLNDHTEAAPSRPLYLASSNKLLDVAREAVTQVLALNHNQLLDDASIEDKLLEVLVNCFKDVTHYMHSLLPAEAKHKFPRETYINYAKFRRLWFSRFGKDRKAVREYGPQISWHIIRGLIKGLSVNDLLSRDEYEDLPKDERTISKSTFESVHDKVWSAWYEKFDSQQEGWDSQDLARYLLEKNLLPRTHVGLFCDEAQDFTRLELEAIYQCSVFSSRIIDLQSLRRIPFVFAGDPFQTLNPTGFRWDSVQAAFTERIVQSLYRFDSGVSVPELHYEELTFNYRSATRIVLFCNAIQAMRAALFSHTSLQPQKTWRLNDDSSVPTFMDQDDVRVQQALKEQSDLTLIVPCEEGEESDYVANDPYLKSFVEQDDEGVPRNVQSAARSKGLEFNRVALYGWSKRPEAQQIATLNRSESGTEIGMDVRLGLEYFMNNLYVAASRAQRRLFVIDSNESIESLWWFASDDEPLRAIAGKLGLETWGENIGPIMRGGIENFQFDQDSNLKMAQRYEAEGVMRSAAYTLKQAAMYYDLVPNLTKASECRAMAYLMGGRYQDAGDSFERAGLLERAVDAFWQGQLFKPLTGIAAKQPSLSLLPQCQVAAFLCDLKSSPNDAVELIASLLRNCKFDAELLSSLRSPAWNKCMDRVLRAVTNSSVPVDEATARVLCGQIEVLKKFGQQISVDLVADLHFLARDFEQVMVLSSHDKGSDRYREAEARHLDTRVGQGHTLERGDIKKVAEYYLRQRAFLKAASLFRSSEEPERILECLRRQIQEDKNPARVERQIVIDAIETLLMVGNWESLVSLVTTGAPGKIEKASASWSKQEASAVLQLVASEKLVSKVVVPGLASSVLLPQDPADKKKHVEEFLTWVIRGWQEAYSDFTALDPRLIGAAVERAGKDLQALTFYERLRDTYKSTSEKAYAERRWVVCKLRQAAREERDGFATKAASHRRSAQDVMRKYGWGLHNVRDEFPDLSQKAGEDRAVVPAPVATSSQSVASVHAGASGSLGSLEFRYVQTKGWINIDSKDGLRARVMMGAPQNPEGDVEFVAAGEDCFEANEWGLHVHWLSSDRVRFTSNGEQLDIVGL
jgi:hypothetical protein